MEQNKSFLSNFCTQKFARVWGEEPQHSNKIYKTLEAVCCFDAAARQCAGINRNRQNNAAHLCAVGKQNPGSASTRFKLVPSKIIHWIIFEVDLCMQSVLGPLFSCKRGPNSRKCACTDKVFRTLRSAPKGFASGHHELFEKSSIKNFIFTQLPVFAP